MSAISPALRVVEYNLMVFRRAWRGPLFISFVSPVLFLAAMGLGLGGLVGRGRGAVGGVNYLDFLAPGLLATTAMQTGAADTTYPIMSRLQWNRIYEAVLNTPVRVRDVLRGELLWITVRMSAIALIFHVVAVCFGAGRTPPALLAVPVAVLTGLAFAAPIMAFTATQRGDTGFNGLNRMVVLPLFLLGGAFFPVAQLPRALQGVAWCTPLSHGVALCRDLYLGTAGLPSALAHLAVLGLYIVVGVMLARVTMRRRLVV